EALLVCTDHPATTPSGLPFDAHLSRSERQQLLSYVLQELGTISRDARRLGDEISSEKFAEALDVIELIRLDVVVVQLLKSGQIL
ncbi:hypothetical protein ABZV34_36920, partial [Streptomyces sp. NPDC005195]|uniref:hypothetical protein n=1 Tax=Streptomyces sp. NPDC005195 TaxID=3154561 RepID=UPI0033AF003B